ncbi:MAG TPA: inositol monophosphatase family protein [Thermoanaerobaculia bacterium]|nr:inositol monophosphatase family protein [Thermoanaerobaculia bacterium]
MTESISLETRRYLEAALAACRRAGEIHRQHFRSAALRVELKQDASPVTVADRGSEEAIRETLHRATPELGLLGEEFGQEGSERNRWIIDPIDATKNFVAGLPFFATLIGLELDGELVFGAVHAPALGPGSGLFASQSTGDSSSLGETWWAARGAGAWGGTGTVIETCRQRRLRVNETSEIEKAFVVHGGLKLFQRHGLWPAFSDLVARALRTRGFGDWWGHILVAEGRCDAMIEARVALHDVAALKPILEEAGGVLLTRGGAPLVTGWTGGALSATRGLAGALREAMGF